MKTHNILTLLYSVMLITSHASATIIVDFTNAGGQGANANALGFVFSSQDMGGTGVSFDVTASAVIPAGGGQFGGDIFRQNSGLGSTVENSGSFLNQEMGINEVLEFTISNVMGLAPGQSIVLANILSQNSISQTADQTGGFGGTFGNNVNDGLTFTSDLGPAIVVNQTDTDLGSILLNINNNDDTNTGNTFAHSTGNFAFTDSFTVQQATGNNAVVIQGFDFVIVVPEPSATLLMITGGLSALFGRRRRRVA